MESVISGSKKISVFDQVVNDTVAEFWLRPMLAELLWQLRRRYTTADFRKMPAGALVIGL